MTPNANTHAARKVLYVEDQSVNVLLMRATFERIPDCELVVADCGSKALELAQGLFPSLLLLDLRLPDLHGAELLRLLRCVPGCEHVPAIAVTAEYKYDSAGAGFQEMWRKPFNLRNAMERTQQLLAQSAASRSPQPEAHPAALEFPELTTPGLVARSATHF